ncbi:MAG: twin-arginine translocase TatA/TatE family subunit [Nocardioides sp.]|uniref:twin-arginine translocase TatA/TatE family subunit n=1 Tax=Nocardioides sp. TaxID=35761 RepID=UPI0039E50894
MIRNVIEPEHLLVILAIVVLVFGGKKLPELARGAGQSVRIFRAEMRAVDADEAAQKRTEDA